MRGSLYVIWPLSITGVWTLWGPVKQTVSDHRALWGRISHPHCLWSRLIACTDWLPDTRSLGSNRQAVLSDYRDIFVPLPFVQYFQHDVNAFRNITCIILICQRRYSLIAIIIRSHLCVVNSFHPKSGACLSTLLTILTWHSTVLTSRYSYIIVQYEYFITRAGMHVTNYPLFSVWRVGFSAYPALGIRLV